MTNNLKNTDIADCFCYNYLYHQRNQELSLELVKSVNSAISGNIRPSKLYQCPNCKRKSASNQVLVIKLCGCGFEMEEIK